LHEIDPDRADKARLDAQKLMQETYTEGKGSAEALALLEKNLARLKVARKHRTHTNRNLESGNFKE
jgi:hypothetical protein